MARLYHRLFYQLHCFFSATAQEGWEEWKALAAVNTLCILIAVEVWVWLLIAAKLNAANPLLTLLDWPNWLDYVVVGACLLGNYAFFLHEDRWQVYAEQFRAEAAPLQRRAAWGSFAAILAVLGSVVSAFYCMSRVDWGH